MTQKVQMVFVLKLSICGIVQVETTILWPVSMFTWVSWQSPRKIIEHCFAGMV